MLPDTVTFWMLMAYCGAALQDKVYVDWSVKPIFPNLPLMIVMPSGRGKTGGMNTIRPLFDICLPYRIREDSTAESAMKQFAENARSYTGNSVCLWEVPEMADVFGRKDYQQGLIARVTRILDAPKDREISRSTGNVHLRIQGHAVMSWIAGTTFEWLGQHVEDAVSSGGFLPRLVTLYTTEAPKWIPDPKRDETIERKLNGELYEMLRTFGKPSPVSLPPEWEDVSKSVYNDLISSGDSQSTAFIARRQENILRIWLILKSLTQFTHDLRTSLLASKYLENQAIRLSEDLILTQNPLLRRVSAFCVSHPQGVSFAAMCRSIRGITGNQLEACLSDLVKQGLVDWSPRTHGEAGIIKPKGEEKANG